MLLKCGVIIICGHCAIHQTRGQTRGQIGYTYTGTGSEGQGKYMYLLRGGALSVIIRRNQYNTGQGLHMIIRRPTMGLKRRMTLHGRF